jgi:hypothetical protein
MRMERALLTLLAVLSIGVPAEDALPEVEIPRGQARRRESPGEHHPALVPEEPTLLPEEEHEHHGPQVEAGLPAD